MSKKLMRKTFGPTEIQAALESGDLTIEQAKAQGLTVIEDCVIPSPQEWNCRDTGGGDAMVRAESAQEAADLYVDGGGWSESNTTTWITVYARREGFDADGEARWIDVDGPITAQLDPDEPECESEHGHLWSDRHEIVGGIESNPGVWGHGGGVKITRVCLRCGCKRVEDSWAQNPETGEQGLDAVEYIENAWDVTEIAEITGITE